jgi:transposase
MTTTWHSREELALQVVTLAKQGVSARATARALGISRNTVSALLARHDSSRQTQQRSALPARPRRAPRPSKLDAFKVTVAQLMARFPDITAQRVFETLRAQGFAGSHSAVKSYVRVVRPPAKPTPSLVTPVYGPGEMAESDWSPYEIAFTDGTKATVQALSYVLVHSKRKFFALYTSNDLYALMDGLGRAFARFDGCAQQCKYDSQKPVVLRWEGNQPIYNPRFVAFASHYEFRPVAVRRGHPNDKPRTERSFWEVERSFLNGREFRSLVDMREQLARWLDEVVDQRRLHKRTALDRFAEEQPQLRELPRHPYDTARVIYRVCGLDGFVAWDGNRYAVPYDHITDILPVRVTQHELFVYAADLRCVARHELAVRGAGLSLDPAGLHPPARRRSPLDAAQLQTAFSNMGERSAHFFSLMSQGPPRVWCAQARQVLLLRERYPTADIELALGHAASFGALDYATIERILAVRAKPRTLDEYVAEETTRRIEQTLGSARTQPRDLTEYDRLPITGTARTSNQETTTWPSDMTQLDPAKQLELPTTPSPSDCDDTSPSSD